MTGTNIRQRGNAVQVVSPGHVERLEDGVAGGRADGHIHPANGVDHLLEAHKLNEGEMINADAE